MTVKFKRSITLRKVDQCCFSKCTLIFFIDVGVEINFNSYFAFAMIFFRTDEQLPLLSVLREACNKNLHSNNRSWLERKVRGFDNKLHHSQIVRSKREYYYVDPSWLHGFAVRWNRFVL